MGSSLLFTRCACLKLSDGFCTALPRRIPVVMPPTRLEQTIEFYALSSIATKTEAVMPSRTPRAMNGNCLEINLN